MPYSSHIWQVFCSQHVRMGGLEKFFTGIVLKFPAFKGAQASLIAGAVAEKARKVHATQKIALYPGDRQGYTGQRRRGRVVEGAPLLRE